MKKPKQELFTGAIIHQQKKKVYDKNSPYYGNNYYKLVIANNFQKHILFAYVNLLTVNLWKIIVDKIYQGNYLFKVQKSKWGWVLLDFQARA